MQVISGGSAVWGIAVWDVAATVGQELAGVVTRRLGLTCDVESDGTKRRLHGADGCDFAWDGEAGEGKCRLQGHCLKKRRGGLFGLLIFGLTFGLFAKAPKRIVSLSPSATEILYAVGAEKQVVAVSEFSDYPAEASKKPVVGGFDGKTLSLEKIISFEPDFVYMTDGMHNFLIDQFKTYGIDYYLSKGDSIEAVKAEILDIGKITGHEKEAKKVVKGIEDDLASPVGGAENGGKAGASSAAGASASGGVADGMATGGSSAGETNANGTAASSGATTIYYEVWNAPFMTCGTKSFIHDVIVKAGCKNIFDDLAEAYPMVSEESIIARNPQVILVPASAGVSIEAVKARAGWSDIDAVKNDRIYLIDDQLYSRPGPRVGKCVKELSGLVR